MVRRAGVLCSRFTLRITQRPDNFFLELGTHLVVRNGRARLETPRILRELLGRCGLNVTRHCCCERGTSADKRTAVKQAVTGNGLQIFRLHDFLQEFEADRLYCIPKLLGIETCSDVLGLWDLYSRAMRLKADLASRTPS